MMQLHSRFANITSFRHGELSEMGRSDGQYKEPSFSQCSIMASLTSSLPISRSRDRARKLAVPAGLRDHAGFFYPHDRTIEHFRMGFAIVVLLLAERPLKGPASERPSRTGPVAGHVAAIAWVEAGHRTGRLKLRLHKEPSKAHTRPKLRRDQDVVLADHPQASENGAIFEENPPELDLVWQRKGLESKLLLHPDAELSRLRASAPGCQG